MHITNSKVVLLTQSSDFIPIYSTT